MKLYFFFADWYLIEVFDKTSRPLAPEIDKKVEDCLEAMIEWYRLTGLEDRIKSLSINDLALKAKQRLFFKWEFWHVNKKDEWELRYTFPINEKKTIYLLGRDVRVVLKTGVVPRYILQQLYEYH